MLSNQTNAKSKPGRACCWVGPGKAAMGSVERFTKGLFGFKQFPVPKAYEAGKIPGRVNMISLPIHQ